MNKTAIAIYETKHYPFIVREISIITDTFTNHTPIIGSCLGAQLIASALGVEVYSGSTKFLPKESGFSKLHTDNTADNVLIPLFEQKIPVSHWQGDI